MAIVAVHKATRVPVKKGDEITSFRGEKYVFQSANQQGRNRVYVTSEGVTSEQEYYPSVFDLDLVEGEVETA